MGFPKAGRISIALAIHSLDRSAHPTYSLDRRWHLQRLVRTALPFILA